MSEIQNLVMVVEDDRDIQESLQSVLETYEYRVVVALHGKEALEQLRAGVKPAVILLDLMMPVMDGFEFRARQLLNHLWKEIPVVVMTAGNQTPQKKETLGEVVFLRKPIAINHLIEVIESVRSGVMTAS